MKRDPELVKKRKEFVTRKYASLIKSGLQQQQAINAISEEIFISPRSVWRDLLGA